MLSPLLNTTLALLFIFLMQCFFTSRDRRFDLPLPWEYTIVHNVLGKSVRVRFGIENLLDPIYASLIFKADLFDLGNASVGYVVWEARQYLSWKVMGALLVAQTMMYGGLVAYFIWLGMRRKRVLL
jgi:hypothetical protein